MQITKREQVETTIAKLLTSDKLSAEEAEAVMFLISDFHKMSKIEEIVIPTESVGETMKSKR